MTMKLFEKNYSWRLLAPMLLISLPFKSLSLLFLLIFLVHFFSRSSNYHLKELLIFVTAIVINGLFIVVDLGYSFLSNLTLFTLFISPLILLIIKNFNTVQRSRKNMLFERSRLKGTIERYIFIQVLFSVLAIISRGTKEGFRFDVNFGDAIAGTFRLPFTYTPDASNVIFAFTMILVVAIYKFTYRKETNKLLEYSAYVIIFLSSVNHLFIALGLALIVVSLDLKRIIRILFAFVFSIYLFSIISPVNFRLITERLNIITSLSSKNTSDEISKNLKVKFITNSYQDLSDNPVRISLIGLGSGCYSSRAALFFTGEYVANFPLKSVSPIMKENTYALWKELKERPKWLQGAFQFPYGSLFSLIMELGIIITVLIFYKLFAKIQSVTSLKFALFFIVFVLSSSLVDNYLEYYQSTFILFLVICQIPKFSIEQHESNKKNLA